jgi:signal-transduction protein with cAMP-binding, CBS, and nucleotidyltransferase domain
VVTIRSDATLSTAVHRLALERIGALVVSDDGARIAGILSERDVVAGLARDGADLLAAGRRVAELMTRNVATCGPDDTVKHLMAEMTRRRVRHLPVVAGDRLVGIVSIGDVVKSRLGEVELEATSCARPTSPPTDRVPLHWPIGGSFRASTVCGGRRRGLSLASIPARV